MQLFKNLWYQIKYHTWGKTNWEAITIDIDDKTMEWLVDESLRTDESVNQIIIRILTKTMKEMSNGL